MFFGLFIYNRRNSTPYLDCCFVRKTYINGFFYLYIERWGENTGYSMYSSKYHFEITIII